MAIKCLVLAGGYDRNEANARFLREARAAARIDSDNVCRVFDVGMLGATAYMVMEYLDGLDLETEIETRGRLPVTEAVDLVIQALDGISAAHALGIVHRDLKPGNLFLTLRSDGTRRLKVLDFGISKVEGLDARLTDTQGSFGTPAYMSPEQVKNAKHTDLRTDIWALGAILYELIAGAPPFVGVSMVPKTADASAPRDVARAQSHPHGIAADPFDTPPRIYWLTDDALVRAIAR